MRVGINSDHQTFLESAKSAADLGVAWVALHARTAAQLYEGRSDWNKITELVEHLAPTGVPVLGNGDIWSGKDALAMMQQTGCAGVVVGRGCLGRPWLFADLVSALNGEDKRVNPTLFEGHHKRIIEFQCRREFEGMNAFPNRAKRGPTTMMLPRSDAPFFLNSAECK